MKGYIIGVYECKVDSKARLMIPAQLKKQEQLYNFCC